MEEFKQKARPDPLDFFIDDLDLDLGLGVLNGS